ncbi:TetR/AcrR family transcriptional regulator [candidate division KSB1 bacterium]|nr:TetR/AcrR family transcriptional regulator [candidate division KSB1 bacterium]
MSISERREREKEQRRNDIINAAEKVFFSKGKDAATMDDVAEASELSKGTLYLYFKNKEELYLAINLRGFKILSDLFAAALAKHNTGIEKIRGIGEAYIQFYKSHPDYFNALLYFESRDIEAGICSTPDATIACECHDYGELTLKLVADALDIGMKDGTIRMDIDPMTVAVVLWGQFSGLIQLVALKGEHLKKYHKMNVDKILATAFELTFQALKTNNG